MRYFIFPFGTCIINRFVCIEFPSICQQCYGITRCLFIVMSNAPSHRKRHKGKCIFHQTKNPALILSHTKCIGNVSIRSLSLAFDKQVHKMKYLLHTHYDWFVWRKVCNHVIIEPIVLCTIHGHEFSIHRKPFPFWLDIFRLLSFTVFLHSEIKMSCSTTICRLNCKWIDMDTRKT